MPPQNCFEGLVDQSISLRCNVEGLEQQVAELYERLQEARIESQTKDNELDRAIMLRAQNDGRKMVEAMHIALPLELCDLVYSYLIPRDTMQDINDMFSSSFPEIHEFYTYPVFGGIYHDVEASPPLPPIRRPAPPYSFSHRENVHPPSYVSPGGRIFRPEFISQDVALDAAKLYYQRNTFKVAVNCRPRALNRLLTVDRFNLGLEPFALIRKLFLQMPARCCRSRRCRWRGSNYPGSANADEIRHLTEYRDDIATNLALLPQESRTKMEITIVIMLRNPTSPEEFLPIERYLLNMLFAIREIVYNLKQHGSKVCICTTVHSGQSVDLTALFTLSAEEWQKQTIESQQETPYIPSQENEVSTGQSNNDISSLVEEARKQWGYESFQASILRHSLGDCADLAEHSIPQSFV